MYLLSNVKQDYDKDAVKKISVLYHFRPHTINLFSLFFFAGSFYDGAILCHIQTNSVFSASVA